MGAIILLVAVASAACLFLFLMAASAIGKRSFTDYPDHVQSAAYLWIDMHGREPRPSYLGGKKGDTAAAWEHLRKKKAQIDTIQNDELRECVRDYVRYYEERVLPRIDRELEDQTSRRELDEYKAQMAAQRRKRDALLADEAGSREVR